MENGEIWHSDTLLRYARKNRIPVAGQTAVPMTIGDTVAAVTNFQVGPFARNLFSTGKLYDAGFDIIYSHELGTYVQTSGKRVEMTREGHVLGLAAKTYETITEAKTALKLAKTSCKVQYNNDVEIVEYVMPIDATGHEGNSPEFSNVGELDDHSAVIDSGDFDERHPVEDAAEAAAAAAPAGAAWFPGQATAAAMETDEQTDEHVANEPGPGAAAALGPNSRV